MTDGKKQAVLRIDPPGYPWQSVESENVTWIILRKKVRFEKEISCPVSLYLDKLTFESVCRGERSLYRGVLELLLTAEGDSGSGKESSIESWDEDACLCRKMLFLDLQSSIWYNPSPKAEARTAFAGFLQNEIPNRTEETRDFAGAQQSNLTFPWQAWFNGQKTAARPQIVKAHVAQIGLYTIIVEIALKIEGPNAGAAERQGSGSLTGRQEIVFNIPGVQVEEILGLGFTRCLYNSYLDQYSGEVRLENLRKDSLIFVDSREGGERLLTASCTNAEYNKKVLNPSP